MTSFGIAFDKQITYEFLLDSVNRFFGNSQSLPSSVVAPRDDNYVIRVNNTVLKISIVNDNGFEQTIEKVEHYLEENFQDQTVGVWYENSKDEGLITGTEKVQVIKLS